MKDNYIVINGKKVELTAEQLDALGIEVETKRKKLFEKVTDGDVYYTISYCGDIAVYTQSNDRADEALFEQCNYFNDEAFAKQVALHQLLYRKLLKFAYEYECEDTTEWDGSKYHWTILYDKGKNKFVPNWNCNFKSQAVYFSSATAAGAAIKEVVDPFMKEHPDFVW